MSHVTALSLPRLNLGLKVESGAQGLFGSASPLSLGAFSNAARHWNWTQEKVIASRKPLFHGRGVIDVLDWYCSWIAASGIDLLSVRQNEKKTAHGYRFLIYSPDHCKATDFPAREFHCTRELRPSGHKFGDKFIP
jgi:hypothetical protein